MFDLICILIAGLLAITARLENKTLALAIFFEFAAHSLLNRYGLIETELLNSWMLYLTYATVQIIVLAYLYSSRASKAIRWLILVNLLINISYSIYTILLNQQLISYEFISIYYQYPHLVGTIMILELVFLLSLNQVVSIGRRNGANNIDNNYSNLRFFRGLSFRSIQ